MSCRKARDRRAGAESFEVCVASEATAFVAIRTGFAGWRTPPRRETEECLRDAAVDLADALQFDGSVGVTAAIAERPVQSHAVDGGLRARDALRVAEQVWSRGSVLSATVEDLADTRAEIRWTGRDGTRHERPPPDRSAQRLDPVPHRISDH